MVDKYSYQKGLGMDKMQWSEPLCSSSDKKGAVSRDSRGCYRKINIRPTRTKEELAVIVKKTEERIVSERSLIKEERVEQKQNSKKRMRENKADISKDTAFTASLFYLQRSLIDDKILSMGVVEAYCPLDSQAADKNRPSDNTNEKVETNCSGGI